MPEEMEIGPTLAERFPIETAFWQANRKALRAQYPGKYLVISGEKVKLTFDTARDLLAAKNENSESTYGLLCLTGTADEDFIMQPYIQVEDN